MKAVILCAGYATRLRPLTDDCPKHLLPVGGRPMLNHVVAKLAPLPLDGIFVVTNRRFHPHFETWAREQYGGEVPLRVLDDGTVSNEDRLGSMGDLEFVIRHEGIDDAVLVVNGDNLFTFSLRPMYAVAREKGNVIACYDVRDPAEARKMGVPTTDGNGRVLAFVEKPEHPSSTEVSIGIYFYTREATARVKTYVEELAATGRRPDTTGEFVGWLAERLPVYTYTFDDPDDLWVDIGTPEQYAAVKASERFQA